MLDHHIPESAEALVRAYAHWQRRRRAALPYAEVVGPASPHITIALSRQAGAGGNTVAEAVAGQLGWTVYDHELLERIAQEMHVRVSLLDSVDERHASWLEQQVEAFSHVPYVTESAFFRHLVETILNLGVHGECIIVGRGANFILPARSTLRVRLIADLDDRISFMADEFGLGRQDAARLVRETDRSRMHFVKEHIHQDLADPLHNDLVLNTSRMSVAECADVIVSAVRGMQRRGQHVPAASAELDQCA